MQSEDYVIEKTANGWVIACGGKSVLICARRKVAEVAVRAARRALKSKIPPSSAEVANATRVRWMDQALISRGPRSVRQGGILAQNALTFCPFHMRPSEELRP
jgi:hypothetical protein